MSYLQKLESIYKAAGAVDFKIAGTLTDQQTRAWMSNVKNKNAFLKMISVRLRSDMSGNTGFINVPATLFGRTAEGTTMVGTNPITKEFSQYILKQLDARVPVGYSVMDDNPGEDLLPKINDVLDTGMGNSLLNLAINGTLDDASAGFLTLMKGWVTKAKASATTKKVLLTVAGNPTEAGAGLVLINHDKTVRRMVEQLPQEDRQGAVVIMSDNDRLKRIDEVLVSTSGDARVIAEAALSAEQKYQCGGRPVVTPDYWPDNFLMLTKLENIELNLHNKVRRTIKEFEENSSIDYIYNIKADCEIVHHAECCIAYVTA